MTRVRIGAAAIALALSSAVGAQSADMTFFVTSTGSGKGADFGGLAGADRLCQTLAAAVGAGRQDVARLPRARRAPAR